MLSPDKPTGMEGQRRIEDHAHSSVEAQAVSNLVRRIGIAVEEIDVLLRYLSQHEADLDTAGFTPSVADLESLRRLEETAAVARTVLVQRAHRTRFRPVL